ncbi:MAG TPA: TrmH family RNA methyltransferase [Candidatus Krumholzibacteria bacterium]|nr:TrmH family RNA methyltransferase [Candidatus Krumholzibacteria bacterium]
MDPRRPRAPLPPVVGVIENVRSLWNVGSMFRSADGAGVHRLVLCGFTAHPPRAEISKTALGAEQAVPWEYWSKAREACEALRSAGFQVIALERAPASVELETLKLRPPVALVVGHETEGVSEATRMACDTTAHLPMFGTKQSLNVAVAFGVAAYAVRRRLGFQPVHGAGGTIGLDPPEP